LAERFGPGFDRRRHAFPRPEDLCEVQSTELRPLGYSVSKGRALVELARGVTSRQVDLASLVELDDQDAVARLRQLRGIGRWTSEYVLLRGLGRIHVFPGDDVGARKSLERWLRLRKPRDYQGVRHVLTRWDPFSGLLYFHLLLDRLNDAGYLSECQSVS
jgi:DNA-3-methyladenine glycosylase II